VKELLARALADGWECSRVLLYDGEAEGFQWSHPWRALRRECTHAIGGDWRNGPELPAEFQAWYGSTQCE
jgi:hypothetical protein